MGLTYFPNGISSFGVPIYGATQDNSGSTYFVDGNSGSDSNEGSTWEKAFKTLARAITISNVDIARGSDRWARRNTIYLAADTTTETLVAFPNKCDVIGVGSYDSNSQPGITGNHAPVNAGNWGTRWYNVWFKGVATASPIVTLASTSGGCQFHGCTFDGGVGTLTYAIQATASSFLKVKNCNIFGSFATGYITFGTGAALGTDIEDCTMSGTAGLGISTVTGTTSDATHGGLNIRRCEIRTTGTGLCIDDEANSSTGIIYCTDLNCINGATLTNYAGRTGILDINETRCIEVKYAGADVAGYIPLWTLT